MFTKHFPSLFNIHGSNKQLQKLGTTKTLHTQRKLNHKLLQKIPQHNWN
jgi:hypothetical protein